MQNSIIDKAKKLGLDTGSGDFDDNLRTIASQVGLHDFNSETDLETLNGILDEKLSIDDKLDDVEDLNIGEDAQNAPIRDEAFGQKEYDRAKKNGVYNADHYKNRQQDLDKKADELNKERKNNWKTKNGENCPVKADGSNAVRKSKMDMVMDNLKYANAKKNAITNKIDAAKAKAYNTTHPGEAINDKAEAKVKEVAKDTGKKAASAVGNAGKKAASKTAQVTAKAGAKLVAFIVANPWVLLVIIIIILIFLIILVVIGDNSKKNGYYNVECDYNLTNVNLNVCNSEESLSLDIKDYVYGTTYALLKDENYNDEIIKAIMILEKTNALGMGNYNNQEKNITIDGCKVDYEPDVPSDVQSAYDSVYSSIENYLYLSSAYDNTITNLSNADTIAISKEILDSLINQEDMDYKQILSNLVGENAINNQTVNNIFIGDTRAKKIMDYGISNNVIYGENLGYDWLIGNGNFNNTNATSGVVNAVDSILSDDKGNIILWLGLSDLKVQDYFDKYKSLAQNEWKNNNIFILPIGPVDESKASIKNEDIDNFNKNMKELISKANITNLKYLNMNYNISNYLEDGINYSEEDYKNILNSIKIGNSNGNYQLYDLASYCEFIETENNNNSSSCEEFSLKSTSLSKSEFVEKVKSYYSGKNGSYAKEFISHAGDIYDICVKNSINPEVLVTRADVEGYSPGSYYNYYGIGCTNDGNGKDCVHYKSFNDGVLGFIKTVSKYNTLSEMMGKYAYIGHTWANPGGPGSGGCYYYPYMKQYLSAGRAAQVAKYCSANKHCSGSGCPSTTDEDQNAYSMYQVYVKMIPFREKIFNITSDECKGSNDNDSNYKGSVNDSPSCTLYSQGDSRWASYRLGYSSGTVSSAGCAITSLTMGIKCSGTTVTINNLNPGTFVQSLNNGKCFDGAGNIFWDCAAIKKIAPNLSNSVGEKLETSSVAEKINKIKLYDPSNYITIFQIRNSSTAEHWVLYQSMSGDTVTVKDPNRGIINTFKISDIKRIKAYKYK